MKRITYHPKAPSWILNLPSDFKPVRLPDCIAEFIVRELRGSL